MLCDSCTACYINGILCHEHGCPDAWRTDIRECKECGCEFTPESRHDKFCSDHCHAMYNGFHCDCELCLEIDAELLEIETE
jgi:hypothetical protein